MEWDINKDLLISVGGQRTQYRLGDGSYLSDMSFVTSSYSLGFGAKFRISKNACVNIAYFFTNYDKFDKEYDSEVSLAGQDIPVHNTDRFTRTNKVLGTGYWEKTKFTRGPHHNTSAQGGNGGLPSASPAPCADIVLPDRD